MINKNLEHIYIKYYKELYLYAFSLCKNTHTTQDLVSDTFLKAIVSLETDHTSPKFWLFRVCKNLYIDHIRRSNNPTITNIIEDLGPGGNNPLDTIILSESKKQLYAKILNLKDEYREVILMFYYLDFSIKEISYTLNVSEGTVKSWLFRSRSKLKNMIKEELD